MPEQMRIPNLWSRRCLTSIMLLIRRHLVEYRHDLTGQDIILLAEGLRSQGEGLAQAVAAAEVLRFFDEAVIPEDELEEAATLSFDLFSIPLAEDCLPVRPDLRLVRSEDGACEHPNPSGQEG